MNTKHKLQSYFARKRLLLALMLLACLVIGAPALAVTPPTLSPTTGCYSTVQTEVTMSDSDPGSTISYQVGGVESLGGTTYTGPVAIPSDRFIIAATATVSDTTSSPTNSWIQSDPNTTGVTRSNLILWLKSDFGPTGYSFPSPAVDNGQFIGAWLDMSASGSENDATQTVSDDHAPTYSNFGAPAGLPSLQFNGTSDYMTLASDLPGLDSGFTMFAVIEPQSTSDGTILVSGNSGPSDMVSLETNGSQLIFNAYNGTTSSSVTSSSGAITQNQYQLVEVVDTGTTATLYVNGTSVGSGTVQSLNDVSRSVNNIAANLAGSTFWNGQIAEVMCYSSGLGSTDREAVENYLTNRYLLNPATVVAPTISVPSTSLSAPTQVAIAADPSAQIFYTLDGTTPDTSSIPYNGPINVYYGLTLNAIAVIGANQSSVSSASYTLDSTQWPAPTTSDTTPLQINVQQPSVALPP